MVQEQYTPVVAEHLAPAVTFEQLDNVFIFTLRDLSRQSIDAWAKKVQAVLDNWPEGEPILTLHHFDTPYATLTPYLKACADQLNNRKHLSRTALVLPRTALTQLMVSLLPKLSRGKAARVFTSREEALAWLQTAVWVVTGRGNCRRKHRSVGWSRWGGTRMRYDFLSFAHYDNLRHFGMTFSTVRPGGAN